MRKFSTTVLLNESNGYTFKLNRKIGEVPDFWDDILDSIEVFKETNEKDIFDVMITKGYISDKAVERVQYHNCVQSAQIINFTNIKSIFPSGIIPDKWNLCIRINICFKQILDLKSLDSLDTIGRRVSIVKTIYKRLLRRGEVMMSYLNNGLNGSCDPSKSSVKPDISIILII